MPTVSFLTAFFVVRIWLLLWSLLVENREIVQNKLKNIPFNNNLKKIVFVSEKNYTSVE